MGRKEVTAVMPSLVKIAEKKKEASSADNEVINREVMGGGKGVLSVPTRGDNEVKGEETERPQKRAFVGDLLEMASPCGALRQEQGRKTMRMRESKESRQVKELLTKNQSQM